VRFLIDMPLSPTLARWLASQGHEAVHAADLNLERTPDTAILTRAVAETRTVITADLDYPRLLALSEAAEPRLILFRHGKRTESEVIARLVDVLARPEQTEITQSILVVDRDRVRRSRLLLA
jgi:predicted nuclease of predicted toxin-antitoxin system